MIKDVESCERLEERCLNKGKALIFLTSRGIEAGYLITAENLQEELKSNTSTLELFCDLVMEGFNQNKIGKELYEDTVNHLSPKQCDKIIVIPHSEVKDKETIWQYDRLGGFCTYSIYKIKNKKILYYGGIMVYPDLQNNGYGGGMMKKAIEMEKPDYIALRTQNPQMYKATEKICSSIYPNGKRQTEEAKEIGNFIANKLQMPNYDKEKMIEKETYGKCLYGTLAPPKKGTEKIFKEVNPYNGDSVVVVGKPRRNLWNN